MLTVVCDCEWRTIILIGQLPTLEIRDRDRGRFEGCSKEAKGDAGWIWSLLLEQSGEKDGGAINRPIGQATGTKT